MSELTKGRQGDIMRLPPGLPVPVDDGACDHLKGMALPSIPLQATDGCTIDLVKLDSRRTIVYAYPRTGEPGKSPPPEWDQIPGARGCTPETCGFRDHHQEMQALGAEVFGLSTQTTEYQQEVVRRLQLPFEILSDEHFKLTRALRLPTFTFRGTELLKRLTLVIRDGSIEKVFYPIFPTDTHAEEVRNWLAQNPR